MICLSILRTKSTEISGLEKLGEFGQKLSGQQNKNLFTCVKVKNLIRF